MALFSRRPSPGTVFVVTKRSRLKRLAAGISALHFQTPRPARPGDAFAGSASSIQAGALETVPVDIAFPGDRPCPTAFKGCDRLFRIDRGTLREVQSIQSRSQRRSLRGSRARCWRRSGAARNGTPRLDFGSGGLEILKLFCEPFMHFGFFR